jgi:DNA invertase Pin-like site-specific DNA recombinase
MKEAVAYCRVACGAEAQRQEHMVRRYADARGLIICETYLDAGVSGGTLERPALQRLLADCRAGKIGTVITQDPERLSRNPLSLIAVLESFLEDGVNVEFSTEEGKARFEFLKVVRYSREGELEHDEDPYATTSVAAVSTWGCLSLSPSSGVVSLPRRTI